MTFPTGVALPGGGKNGRLEKEFRILSDSQCLGRREELRMAPEEMRQLVISFQQMVQSNSKWLGPVTGIVEGIGCLSYITGTEGGCS